jgi:hypothetical protein
MFAAYDSDFTPSRIRVGEYVIEPSRILPSPTDIGSVSNSLRPPRVRTILSVSWAGPGPARASRR